MSVVRVKLNRRGNVGILGRPNADQKENPQRFLKEQRVAIGRGKVLLKPGLNDIPSEIWATIADLDYTKALMAEDSIDPRGHKVLEVLSEMAPAADSDEGGKDARRSGQSAVETIKLIKATDDPEVLAQIGESDNRKTVQDALKARREELESDGVDSEG